MMVCPLEMMLDCIDFEKTNQQKLQRQIDISKKGCVKTIMNEQQLKIKH